MLWWMLACTALLDEATEPPGRAAVPPPLGDGAVKRAVVTTAPATARPWEPSSLPDTDNLLTTQRAGVVAARMREPGHPWLSEVAERAQTEPALGDLWLERDEAACQQLGAALLAATPADGPPSPVAWSGLLSCPESLRAQWASDPRLETLAPMLDPAQGPRPDPLLDDLPSLVRWGPPPSTWPARYPRHLRAIRQAAEDCVLHESNLLSAERCLAGLAAVDRPAAVAQAEALVARSEGMELPVARELIRWPTVADRDRELDSLGLGPSDPSGGEGAAVLIDALQADGHALRAHPSRYPEVHLASLLQALGIDGVVIDSRQPTPDHPQGWLALHAHHDAQRLAVLSDRWGVDSEQIVGLANVLADRADVPHRAALVEHVDGPAVLVGPEAALEALNEARVVYVPEPRERWFKDIGDPTDTGLTGVLEELLGEEAP